MEITRHAAIPNQFIFLCNNHIYSMEYIGGLFLIVSSPILDIRHRYVVLKDAYSNVILLDVFSFSSTTIYSVHKLRNYSWLSYLETFIYADYKGTFNINHGIILNVGRYLDQTEWRYIRYELCDILYTSHIIDSKMYSSTRLLDIDSYTGGTLIVSKPMEAGISSLTLLYGSYYSSFFLSRSRIRYNLAAIESVERATFRDADIQYTDKSLWRRMEDNRKERKTRGIARMVRKSKTSVDAEMNYYKCFFKSYVAYKELFLKEATTDRILWCEQELSNYDDIDDLENTHDNDKKQYFNMGIEKDFTIVGFFANNCAYNVTEYNKLLSFCYIDWYLDLHRYLSLSIYTFLYISNYLYSVYTVYIYAMYISKIKPCILIYFNTLAKY